MAANFICVKYHQRLFTLDNQVQFLDSKSLENFGQWLLRRGLHLQEKKHEAIEKFNKLGVGESVLRAEWMSQVQEQTKPVPRTLILAFSLFILLSQYFRSITNSGAAGCQKHPCPAKNS